MVEPISDTRMQSQSLQGLGEIAPTDLQKRYTVLYDTEVLSQLQEFAYIYSSGEFSSGDGSYDQQPTRSTRACPHVSRCPNCTYLFS